jgi:soluble P-type ATPase
MRSLLEAKDLLLLVSLRKKLSGKTEHGVIRIAVPGRGSHTIEHLILDLNGTISVDGRIVRGVKEKLRGLSEELEITVVTADTNRNAESLLAGLPVRIHMIRENQENEQKLAVVLEKGKGNTVSIGNGCNDVSMLRESVIGICVVGKEGASPEALMASDVVVPTINDALDLLLKPQRLRATLRR